MKDYNTNNNPCRVVGNVVKKEKREISFWTIKQYYKFDSFVDNLRDKTLA